MRQQEALKMFVLSLNFARVCLRLFLGPAGLEEAMAKIDIEVNESLVGAVLGPAGRHIVEIQQYRWK